METPAVRMILEHIGEPTRLPALATAHGPPAWSDAPVEVDPDYDLLAQPEPEPEPEMEMGFDQRIQW